MVKNRWLGLNSAKHLSEDTLLLHIDGALSKREEEAAARHLRDCWRCRSLKDRLESAIGAFMEERRDDLNTLDAEFQDKNSFASRLERHAAHTPDPPPSRFRFFRLAPRAMWPLAAAAAALAATGAWLPLREYAASLEVREDIPAIAVSPAPPAPLPRIALPITIPPAAPAPAPQPPTPKWQLPPAAAGPTSDDLDAAELGSYAALHDLGLCRGGAIEVLRIPGEAIRIIGAADRQEQAENLKAALAGLKHIDVRVAAAGDDLPPAAEFTPSGARLEPRPPLLAARLTEHFQRHSPPDRAGRDMADYSSHTVRLAATASYEAQALRTLTGVFTVRRLRAMNAADRARLARVADEHLRELEQSLNLLEQNLDQLGHDVSHPAVEPPLNIESWEELIVLLARHAARMDYLTGGLFAGLDLRGLDAETAWSELRTIHTHSQSLLKTAGAEAQARWRGDEVQSMRTIKQEGEIYAK